MRAENNCRIDLRVDGGALCVCRLRLDTESATYRIGIDGQQSPMCDFGVVVRRDRSVAIVAIEIKAGAADPSTALGQLQAGINLLSGCLERQAVGRDLAPLAYLVVGRGRGRLMHLLRSGKRRITFGGQQVEITVVGCGAASAI